MPRLCIVMGGHFSATIGGAQYQAQCILEQLVATRRFDIFYLARAINPAYRPDGYAILQIAKPGRIRQYSFAFDARALLRLLNDIRPDVIYQRGLKAHTGIVAYYGKKSACRTIFHISSDLNVAPNRIVGQSPMQWLKRLDRKMEEYGIANVTDIVAQTKIQGALLLKNYGRRPTDIVPNFHPTPNEMLQKHPIDIRVLWVANFKAVKRPELFVDLAESLVDQQNIRFVMIGRAGESARYASLHERIKQLPNVDYLGEVPIEQVNDELARGHMLVNTSSAEGFPNTFIQAWMRRVPTLSLGVNPDGVFDSENIGFCTDSLKGLSDAVVKLARDHGLRETMGANAERYALNTHSPKAVERLIQIFDEPTKA